MDFDFKHIAAPFRMHPGLARLDARAAHLTRLDPASVLYQEKRAVYEAGAALHCVAGFDPADALHAIWDNARTSGAGPLPEPPAPLELAFEEDFAVLDAATETVPWMCVCVPSHWAPEDKLGKSLAAMHAPVADSADLNAAWPHMSRLVGSGGHWERFVWTISPSPRYGQHPRRHARQPWPRSADPAEFAAACHFRAERQTFLPVNDRQGQPKGQTVFTIRVMVEPLASVVRHPEQARQLYDALGSMNADVLLYKNLEAARAPLLAWLSSPNLFPPQSNPWKKPTT